MEMIEVCLETAQLAEMKDFYNGTLGLALLEEEENSFAVQAGATKLCFVRGEGNPFYHFAFNIPENKIEEAIKWLDGRVKLLEEEGETLVFFPHWNAHSIYFLDPAGNIVEFISRHNLANRREGAFTSQDILCVSEIGMPVDDVMDTIEKMQTVLQLPVWREPTSQFAPLGGEDGLFILVAIGRTWFMSDRAAHAYPLKVTIKGKRNVQTFVKSYHIKVLEESSLSLA